MKAARQHVLEEPAEELEGLKVDMPPGADATVAKRPAQPSIGQELEWAVAGGGFEDVTAEVAEGVLAAAGGRAVDHPALLPHLGREVGQRLGHLFLEGLPE
jgi:adenosylmethionine-8-amino-7-oxononanoate aminotransferase